MVDFVAYLIVVLVRFFVVILAVAIVVVLAAFAAVGILAVVSGLKHFFRPFFKILSVFVICVCVFRQLLKLFRIRLLRSELALLEVFIGT